MKITTKEFIEMLKKADPKGDGFIRLVGGIPIAAEAKEGYWDGPFTYIDDNNNFVTSINGYKVDIHQLDLDDWVSNQVNIHDPNNWENIKSKIKFEFDGYSRSQKDREDSILSSAKESWETMAKIKRSHFNKSLEEMRLNAKKGWTWFQNKLVDTEGKLHHYYTWKIFDENKISQGGSNVHMTECVQKSGEWEKLDNGVLEGYYQWVYKL